MSTFALLTDLAARSLLKPKAKDTFQQPGDDSEAAAVQELAVVVSLGLFLYLALTLGFLVWGLHTAYKCKAGPLEFIVAFFEPFLYRCIRICVPCKGALGRA